MSNLKDATNYYEKSELYFALENIYCLNSTVEEIFQASCIIQPCWNFNHTASSVFSSRLNKIKLRSFSVFIVMEKHFTVELREILTEQIIITFKDFVIKKSISENLRWKILIQRHLPNWRYKLYRIENKTQLLNYWCFDSIQNHCQYDSRLQVIIPQDSIIQNNKTRAWEYI